MAKNRKTEKVLQTAAETMADTFAAYLRFLYRGLTPGAWAGIQEIAPLINSKEDYAVLLHEKLQLPPEFDLDFGWRGCQMLKLMTCMSFADLIKVADGITGKLGRRNELQRFREIIARHADCGVMTGYK